MPLTKTINLAALQHNWRRIRRLSTAKHLLAVVKSDAYGHGLLPVAQALSPFADGFAVTIPAAAIVLRDSGVRSPIVLLEGMFSQADAPLVTEYQLSPVVHEEWHLQALKTMPSTARLTVYLKINSGMNRLGFAPEAVAAALESLQQTAAVRDIVLMTHFANADSRNGIEAPLQTMAAFRGLKLPLSLGNSAATLLHDDISDDWARVGIALYGASPAPAWQTRDTLGLSAVMSLTTRLISTRKVRRSDAVGYGGEFVADSDMHVGVAAIGYGDGYPRRQGMTTLVGGLPAPVIGRVSMGMITLNLSAQAAAGDGNVGDEVVLWGDNPPVENVAAAAETISYDLLTAVSAIPSA